MSTESMQRELSPSIIWEIGFIFLANSGFESGDQMGTFDERPEVKNLMQVYLWTELTKQSELTGNGNLSGIVLLKID